MISKKITTGLNGQVAAELYSAYLYLAMEWHLTAEGFSGLAAWARRRSDDELQGARELAARAGGRGVQLKPGPLEAPPAKWKGPEDLLEAAGRNEAKLISLLNNLLTLAGQENDHPTAALLQSRLAARLEREAATLALLRRFRLAAGQSPAWLLLDRELPQ